MERDIRTKLWEEKRMQGRVREKNGNDVAMMRAVGKKLAGRNRESILKTVSLRFS